MKKDHFTFDELEAFFDKYPAEKIMFGGYRYSVSAQKISDYVKGFKYLAETGIDIMPEYFTLISIIDSHIEHRGYIYNSPSCVSNNLDCGKWVHELNAVLNYNGVWDIDEILGYYGATRDIIKDDLYEIINDFPTANSKYVNKTQDNLKEYIESYYKAERTLTKNDIDLFFKSKVDSNKTRYSRDFIDIRDIKYPILVILYAGGQVESIHLVRKNFDTFHGNKTKTSNFDSYAYFHINEEDIDDIHAEAIVRYDPINIHHGAISVRNSIYRTLNHIKKRYKNEKDINLSVVKKVIKIYEIPLHTLSNGQRVVDKDLFDNAIEQYYGCKFDR